MAIKVKAIERKLKFEKGEDGAYEYRYVLQADLYNKLSQAKVIQEASLRSGIAKGSMNAAWDAIGEVIKAWATEGHSVAVPGLGTMRFGLRSKSVKSVNDVATKLITSRRVIFTPNSDIKNELKATSISITCYDRNGEIVKRVNSSDDGDIEDEEKDYKVVLTANPEEGGTVSGAGGYDEGDSVTIKAVAKSGYKFVKWSDGNTNATRTFDATEDVNLTATFEKVESSTGGGSTTGGGTSGTGGNTSGTPTGETVKLSTYKNPSLGGSVTAGGTYDKGTEVTIEATPAEGYLFDMWSDHVTDNPRTLTLTANKSVTAWFYKEGEQKPSEMEDSETQL